MRTREVTTIRPRSGVASSSSRGAAGADAVHDVVLDEGDQGHVLEIQKHRHAGASPGLAGDGAQPNARGVDGRHHRRKDPHVLRIWTLFVAWWVNHPDTLGTLRQ